MPQDECILYVVDPESIKACTCFLLFCKHLKIVHIIFSPHVTVAVCSIVLAKESVSAMILFYPYVWQVNLANSIIYLVSTESSQPYRNFSEMIKEIF